MPKTADLPRRLQDLPDDPYRTLAWLVRKNEGFCKSSQEFAEFTWADWMRNQGKTAVPALAFAEVARATSPALWADKKKYRDSACSSARHEFGRGTGWREAPGVESQHGSRLSHGWRRRRVNRTSGADFRSLVRDAQISLHFRTRLGYADSLASLGPSLRHNVEFAVKLFQHCATNHALEVPSAMRAIPIDVLRAFVAVVDSRGFTRAAEDLGRTQPTVSLQVKRLEELIEAPLFEKASRLILTRSGEICLDYGRKILAQHDEMLDFVVRQRSGSDPIRLGMPSEFAAFLVPNLASLTRRDGQRLHFDFTCEMSETLLDRLRANQLDVALALMSDGGAEDAVAEWRLPMGWISAPGYQAPKDSPVQLITTPERSLYYQIATAALHRAGRKFEIVCKSANFDVLKTAVNSGFGVSAIAKGLAPKGSQLVPSAQIAGLPDVTLGLFARAGGASPPSRPLVEHMIDVLSTSPALGHT